MLKSNFLLRLFFSREIWVCEINMRSYLCVDNSGFWIRVSFFCFCVLPSEISFLFWIHFRSFPNLPFVLSPKTDWAGPDRASFNWFSHFISKTPLKILRPRFRTGRPAVRTPPAKGNRGNFGVIFWRPVETFAYTVILVHPPVANASFIGWPY